MFKYSQSPTGPSSAYGASGGSHQESDLLKAPAILGGRERDGCSWAGRGWRRLPVAWKGGSGCQRNEEDSESSPERCYKGDEEGLGVHKTWVLRASSQG